VRHFGFLNEDAVLAGDRYDDGLLLRLGHVDSVLARSRESPAAAVSGVGAAAMTVSTQSGPEGSNPAPSSGESLANLNCASRRHSFSKKTFPKGTSELDLAVSKSEASSGGAAVLVSRAHGRGYSLG
jgi:hypothetical protein